MNNSKTLPAPRTISEQFEVFGFEYAIGDGHCIGLDHELLDGNAVYVDWDEDEPNYYMIEGHVCYSIEDAVAVLEDIKDNPEMYLV